MANFLYNGVELPDIDSVWTDKETYPYAYMEVSDFSQFGVNAVVYVVDFFDKPLVFDTDGMRGYAPCAYKSYIFVGTQAEMDALAAVGMPLPAYGIWVEEGIYTVEDENSYTPRPNTTMGFTALWTNHDVLSVTDNSVYFAASEPVPVGGGSGDDGGGESTAPKHYCRVDGSVYEVEGGTAKMGGTFCEVKSGTVLIDGTVYDFALN